MTFSINLNEFNNSFEGIVSPIQNSIPSVKLYEITVADLAENQIEKSKSENYASWTKAMDLNAQSNGLRSSGFWREFYKSLMGNNFEYDLSIENIVGSTDSVMQFIPMSSRGQSGAASYVYEIAKEMLSQKYIVTLLHGDNDITNESSEQVVKDLIKQAEFVGKKVWIISQSMASRSFSIPSIDTVLLCYDRGSLNATQQKLSRALTAGEVSKVGKIISCSVDPNRDDKLTGIILETAIKAAERDDSDLNDELLRAFATFPLFVQDDTGAVLPISEDEYLRRAMDLNSMMRVSINKGTLHTIDPDLVDIILSGSNEDVSVESRLGDREALESGERFADKAEPASKKSANATLKSLNQLYENMQVFVERLEYISYFTDIDRPSINDILEAVSVDEDTKEEFRELSGMTVESVNLCFDNDLMSRQWIDSVILSSRGGHS